MSKVHIGHIIEKFFQPEKKKPSEGSKVEGKQTIHKVASTSVDVIRRDKFSKEINKSKRK